MNADCQLVCEWRMELWRMEMDARTRIRCTYFAFVPVSYSNLCGRYCVITNRRLMLIKCYNFSGRREMKSIAFNCIFHFWLLVEWMKYERLLRCMHLFLRYEIVKLLEWIMFGIWYFLFYFLLPALCDNYVIILQLLSIALLLCGCSVVSNKQPPNIRKSARW